MTLILSRQDVEALMTMELAIDAVTEAFHDHGDNRTRIPDRSLLRLEPHKGILGIMPAYMERLDAAGIKLISHHDTNHKKNLPESLGLIVYYHAATGIPLCIMDCAHITKMRTGAATAVSVSRLARKNSRTLGVVGAGAQAPAQIEAVRHFCHLQKVRVFDVNPAHSAALSTLIEESGLQAEIMEDPEKTCLGSDILVTCTTSTTHVIQGKWVKPGMHIVGVGADMPHKRELAPEVYARADKWVTDIPRQAIITGEIDDAFKSGTVSPDTLHGTLGEIVAGKKDGREHDNEITIFKSTGMAIQDVAAAKKVYEAALKNNAGIEISITP